MADAIEVKKWFHEGNPDPISNLQWRMMHPDHRFLFNLYREKEQLNARLEVVEAEIAARSNRILEEIADNPESPKRQWCWWEILEAPHPKWAKEYEAALGKAAADAVRARYKKTESIFLRIQYIHPRPPDA